MHYAEIYCINGTEYQGGQRVGRAASLSQAVKFEANQISFEALCQQADVVAPKHFGAAESGDPEGITCRDAVGRFEHTL
jgi:hypothetical protein